MKCVDVMGGQRSSSGRSGRLIAAKGFSLLPKLRCQNVIVCFSLNLSFLYSQLQYDIKLYTHIHIYVYIYTYKYIDIYTYVVHFA